MPTKQEHLDQANHNEQFYGSFNRADYKDWAVTVLFYIALQYIDAFLATKGIHPGKHDTRDNSIQRISEIRSLWPHYRFMKDHSRTARYYPPTGFSMSDINSLETNHLQQIKVGVRPHL